MPIVSWAEHRPLSSTAGRARRRATGRLAAMGLAVMVVAPACRTGPLPTVPPGPPEVEVEVLEGLDSQPFFGVDTNARGQVAGTFFGWDDIYGFGRPAIWDRGTVTEVLPGARGWTTALNEAGDVVGPSVDASTGLPAAFIWQGGVLTTIPWR